MHILFIASWYPNKENPTNGNFIEKHAEAISKIHDISLISFVASTEVTKTLIQKNDKGKLIEYIIYYPKIKGKSKVINSISKFLIQFNYLIKVYKIIKSERSKPKLIHLHVCLPYGIWAYLLSKIYTIPYLVTEHSSAFHSELNTFTSKQKKIVKFILKKSSHIVPVSENLKNHLQKIAPKVNYTVISNVVNEAIFYPKNIELNKTKFIHISNAVESAKNIKGIIEVVCHLSKKRRDFELEIISDGDVSGIRKIADNCALTDDFIHFKAAQSTEEIADSINHSTCLLLFSNYENFPCVIPEAWMCGKPVIATNVNGIPEHVNAKNGILIEKGDKLALEDSLIAIIDKTIQFDANEIRNYAKLNFSYKVIAENFDSVYQKVLG